MKKKGSIKVEIRILPGAVQYVHCNLSLVEPLGNTLIEDNTLLLKKIDQISLLIEHYREFIFESSIATINIVKEVL